MKIIFPKKDHSLITVDKNIKIKLKYLSYTDISEFTDIDNTEDSEAVLKMYAKYIDQ